MKEKIIKSLKEELIADDQDMDLWKIAKLAGDLVRLLEEKDEGKENE